MIVENPHLFVKPWDCRTHEPMVYCGPMIELTAWEARRDRILVMGILNTTPDSFYEASRVVRRRAAIARALRMVEDGADIVDVGGESTRPGSASIPVQEEMDRVLPVVEGVRKRSDVILSVDTTKAPVAEEALAAGAQIVNDVSAMRHDERMGDVVARSGAFVVLMHMLGRPETMQQDPTYADVVEDIHTFLAERIRAALGAGIDERRILVDPGIGFGKTLDHNLALLRNLDRLTDLGRPVLVGLSRKSFLGAILDLPAEERIEGTIAADAIAIVRGASIIRVHDVKEGRRTADVAERLRCHGVASH